MIRRNLIPIVVVLAMSPLCAAQTISSGRTIRHHLEAVPDPIATPEVLRAEDAMEKKDFPSAEKDLLAATAKDPKNYRAWFDLGYLYNATDRKSQAVDAYRKSVEANPQVFESNLNLGLSLAQAGDAQAEKYLRDATKLKPTAHQGEGWYRAWLSIGQLLEKTKPQEAVEAFRNAAKFQPNQAEPHFAAGVLLERENQFEQAAAEYGKAANLDPKSSDALAGLVNCYTKLEKLPEAEAALRKYIVVDPNNATAHVQLGRVLAAEHKWDDATAELEQGLKLQPGDIQAVKQLASIYMEQKDYDKAIPHIRAALQTAPNDAQLHHWLGVSLLDNKQFPEAQNELISAVKLKPDFGAAYGDLAFAASENKNYVLTIQALDARAKYLRELPATYFLRATAYDHLRQPKLAAENYRKFLSVADGRFPDQEWQAKHRLIAIDPDHKK